MEGDYFGEPVDDVPRGSDSGLSDAPSPFDDAALNIDEPTYLRRNSPGAARARERLSQRGQRRESPSVRSGSQASEEAAGQQETDMPPAWHEQQGGETPEQFSRRRQVIAERMAGMQRLMREMGPEAFEAAVERRAVGAPGELVIRDPDAAPGEYQPQTAWGRNRQRALAINEMLAERRVRDVQTAVRALAEVPVGTDLSGSRLPAYLTDHMPGVAPALIQRVTRELRGQGYVPGGHVDQQRVAAALRPAEEGIRSVDDADRVRRRFRDALSTAAGEDDDDIPPFLRAQGRRRARERLIRMVREDPDSFQADEDALRAAIGMSINEILALPEVPAEGQQGSAVSAPAALAAQQVEGRPLDDAARRRAEGLPGLERALGGRERMQVLLQQRARELQAATPGLTDAQARLAAIDSYLAPPVETSAPEQPGRLQGRERDELIRLIIQSPYYFQGIPDVDARLQEDLGMTLDEVLAQGEQQRGAFVARADAELAVARQRESADAPSPTEQEREAIAAIERGREQDHRNFIHQLEIVEQIRQNAPERRLGESEFWDSPSEDFNIRNLLLRSQNGTEIYTMAFYAQISADDYQRLQEAATARYFEQFQTRFFAEIRERLQQRTIEVQGVQILVDRIPRYTQWMQQWEQHPDYQAWLAQQVDEDPASAIDRAADTEGMDTNELMRGMGVNDLESARRFFRVEVGIGIYAGLSPREAREAALDNMHAYNRLTDEYPNIDDMPFPPDELTDEQVIEFRREQVGEQVANTQLEEMIQGIVTREHVSEEQARDRAMRTLRSLIRVQQSGRGDRITEWLSTTYGIPAEQVEYKLARDVMLLSRVHDDLNRTQLWARAYKRLEDFRERAEQLRKQIQQRRQRET